MPRLRAPVAAEGIEPFPGRGYGPRRRLALRLREPCCTGLAEVMSLGRELCRPFPRSPPEELNLIKGLRRDPPSSARSVGRFLAPRVSGLGCVGSFRRRVPDRPAAFQPKLVRRESNPRCV